MQLSESVTITTVVLLVEEAYEYFSCFKYLLLNKYTLCDKPNSFHVAWNDTCTHLNYAGLKMSG